MAGAVDWVCSGYGTACPFQHDFPSEMDPETRVAALQAMTPKQMNAAVSSMLPEMMQETLNAMPDAMRSATNAMLSKGSKYFRRELDDLLSAKLEELGKESLTDHAAHHAAYGLRELEIEVRRKCGQKFGGVQSAGALAEGAGAPPAIDGAAPEDAQVLIFVGTGQRPFTQNDMDALKEALINAVPDWQKSFDFLGKTAETVLETLLERVFSKDFPRFPESLKIPNQSRAYRTRYQWHVTTDNYSVLSYPSCCNNTHLRLSRHGWWNVALGDY